MTVTIDFFNSPFDKEPTLFQAETVAHWILVDKATADNYTYDTAYIDHLIDKINSGTYDVDLLSASEQEQVAQRLQTKTNNT